MLTLLIFGESKVIGIYKIENKVNHKCYIGQSIDIERRWRGHKRAAIAETHSEYHTPVHSAMRKYGLENFDFSVIEVCSKEELNEREIYWIAFYESLVSQKGYNLSPGGGRSTKIIDEEQIRKLWKEGKTVSEIQEITKYNPRTIKLYLGDLYDSKEGTRRGRNKATKARQHPICQYDLEGNFIAQYTSLTEVVEKTGLDKRHIPSACKGQDGRKTYAGYQWRYAEDPPPGPTTHWRRKFLDSEVRQWKLDYQNGVGTIPELYKKYHPNCSQAVFYNIIATDKYYMNVLEDKEGASDGTQPN